MDLKDIKGFGEKRIEVLNAHGIYTVLDLLRLEPHKYLDYSCVLGANKLNPNPQTVKVQVLAPAKCAYFKGKSSVTTKVLDLVSNNVYTAVWYNQPFMKNNLKTDDVFYLTGKFNKINQFVVTNLMACEKVTNDIIPVYGASAGLTSQLIRTSVKQILESNENFSVISKLVEEENGIMPLMEAFRELHFPTNIDKLEESKQRITLEEMFFLSALEKKVKENIQEKTRVYNKSAIEEFCDACPYTLTQDQSTALDEISKDMQSEQVMNRLLLGDVGSGKTLVALGACYLAINSGFQAVILCPTEILTSQHFESAKRIFNGLNVKIDVLHSKLNTSKKQEVLKGLESGEISLLISTHSSLSEKVHFNNLGLVVTDEQHRFGVAERAGISKKGDNPDVLIMSATPIPRSLSLVLFGGLSVSEIKTRPAGESKIKTNIVSTIKEKDMWKYLLNEINENNGKCFVIVPRIEDGGDYSTLSSVGSTKNKLIEFGVPEEYIATVHGKTDKETAAQLIQSFKNGDKKILISTTIVEVGIDVPTANLMVIYNGERFGLASLHQLRGRIGRDGRSGYCFVMADTTSEIAVNRLEIFKKYNSGIKLAEEDLKLRGAGTMYGTKQHGASEIFLNLDFSVDQYKLASEIISKLSEQELQKIYPLAEAKFGDIYKKVVLN